MARREEDDDDLAGGPAGMGHNSNATGDELLQFIERVEQLRKEQDEIKEQEKEVFVEMKGRGFDTKTVRAIIKIRQKSPDERQEEEALLDTYLHALGMI